MTAVGESSAVEHVAAAQREAADIPGLAGSISLRPVRSAGIVGAGTMGGGIAMNFLNAGIPVVLLDANQQALERGAGQIRTRYEASAAKGKLDPAELERRMRLVTTTLDHAALSNVDL